MRMQCGLQELSVFLATLLRDWSPPFTIAVVLEALPVKAVNPVDASQSSPQTTNGDATDASRRIIVPC